MKLIKLEENKDKYTLKFIGKTHDLIDFLDIVTCVPYVSYNIIFKIWEINKNKLDDFLTKYYDICTFTDNEIKVTDFNNIGEGMKLKPYEYQKEAIDFTLKQDKSLLILPCGAGK